MASVRLDPLMSLARRSDHAGHHARVNVVRILTMKGLLAEARMGYVEGITPEDVEMCLSGEDAKEVQADLCRDPAVIKLLPQQLSVDEWGRWKITINNPGQMALF